MEQPIIHSLFPIPVYKTKMDRDFTNQELSFAKEQKNHCIKNNGNINTKDNYILNRKEFINIKSFLEGHCKNYIDTVICPKNKIDIRITQSWLNYTEQNEFHHMHSHPNSFVSGVLYFDCDSNNDKIVFTKSEYQQISPEVENYNLWNSHMWWFHVGTGDLVMFPSSTLHQVEAKKGTNTRISLAFNTFISGLIGEPECLNELNLG